jgi:hypothetical protein
MSANLMEYFNKSPRLGVLSTSSKEGKVDSAVFGSPHMIDEKTILIATSQNRTYTNLMENPYAVYIIVEEPMDTSKDTNTKEEPGPSILDWKGIRVYMKMKEHHTAGHLLETIQSQIASIVGEEASKMIHAAVTFEIYEVRPLVDFGQNWEESI